MSGRNKLIENKKGKNKRISIIYTGLAIFILLVVVLGATYAYFTAQSADGANIDTNVITEQPITYHFL